MLLNSTPKEKRLVHAPTDSGIVPVMKFEEALKVVSKLQDPIDSGKDAVIMLSAI